MNFRLKSKSKRSKGGKSAAIAIGLGALLAAWGYRRWSRRNAAKAAPRPGHGQPQDSENPSPEEKRLAEKFHSLDAENTTPHIPKDLERDPKNIEQTIHPG